MASKIEETIEDLEEYIDSCKPSAFSSSKIVVNRDELEVYISELKSKIPEEVSRYQKMLNNQESILAEAKRQAKDIIEAAKIHTNELVSEHQIMQEAYAKANEVVAVATKNAQDNIDSATRDANEIRRSAIAYTDELLSNVQEILVKSIDLTRRNQNTFLDKMQGYLDTVVANRISLSPNPIVEDIMADNIPDVDTPPSNEPLNPAAHTAGMEKNMMEIPLADDQIDTIPGNTGVLDIPEEFFKKD